MDLASACGHALPMDDEQGRCQWHRVAERITGRTGERCSRRATPPASFCETHLRDVELESMKQADRFGLTGTAREVLVAVVAGLTVEAVVHWPAIVEFVQSILYRAIRSDHAARTGQASAIGFILPATPARPSREVLEWGIGPSGAAEEDVTRLASVVLEHFSARPGDDDG